MSNSVTDSVIDNVLDREYTWTVGGQWGDEEITETGHVVLEQWSTLQMYFSQKALQEFYDNIGIPINAETGKLEVNLIPQL